MNYDYNYILGELTKYDDTFSIGKSSEGRKIHVISIGKGERRAVFAAAFHALEYLTAPALLAFAEQYRSMRYYHNDLRVFFVPMMNPDGIEIVLHGLDPSNAMHREIIKHNGIIDYGKVWQANAAGVDINHNFNADWAPILDKPSPSKFGGRYPESEPETRALTQFLSGLKPELFIAFHSQGKEIYYDFNGMESERAEATAKTIGAKSGYRVCSPTGTAAFGGAKDWYIQGYHQQAFTVELGCGENPLPESELAAMQEDTEIICKAALHAVFR